MSLLSFFKRAKEAEKDIATQVDESFNRLRLEIFKTLATAPDGRHTWKITHSRIDGPRYGVNCFYSKGEIEIEAREALRRSQGYEDVHAMCKARNAQIEFGSHDNIKRENAVVTYITIDTTKPYRAPDLPVGPNAKPSTILHGECLDDDPRIQYDNEGFAYLGDANEVVVGVQTAQGDIRTQPAAAKQAQQLTAPKITFAVARV